MSVQNGQRRVRRSSTTFWNAKLSKRQNEVAEWVVMGRSNRDIAARLTLSQKTVEKHVSNIFRKLGVKSRAQLAVYIVTWTGPVTALPAEHAGGSRAPLVPLETEFSI